MSEDLLLDWMSERGAGTWQQARDAHEWLLSQQRQIGWRPTPGFTLRMLSTLGHVEIDWEAARWAAAPPVITLLPSAGAHALLTGGRTRTLVDRLGTEAGEDPCLFALSPHPQSLAPSALLVACESERAIESLAWRLGIRYEFSVSDRLSAALPPLDACLHQGKTTPPPRGYGVECFDARRLRWETAESDESPGLYRYEVYGRPEFRLLTEAEGVYSVDLPTGVWSALSRWGENRLRYQTESVNGTLIVPIECPLPTLQARAAALCSGLAPKKRGQTLWFRNVPRAIAERIARSLDQTVFDEP